MPIRTFRSFAALAALLGAGHRLVAQVDTTHVTLSGLVVDTDRKPLEGVDVRLVGDTIHHSTSSLGTFRLYGPRGVELLLQFRRVGFNAQLLKVAGDWNGTVLMVPGAFTLPEVQVNARNAKPAEYANTNKYDDFFKRRRQGLGEFLTRDDLERRNALHVPEVLEGKPGIRVSVQPGRGTSVAMARCNEYPPQINVYVDGVKLIPNGGQKSPVATAFTGPRARDPEIAGQTGEMLNRLNLRDVEMIEIFRGPGELPPEFNDGNCAAIVVWTRQGGR